MEALAFDFFWPLQVREVASVVEVLASIGVVSLCTTLTKSYLDSIVAAEDANDAVAYELPDVVEIV